MSQILYYLDAYSDETIAADAPTLEAWAAWLAKPFDATTQNWGRADLIQDGAEFTASVLEQLEDLEVTRTVQGWMYSRQVEPDANFFAQALGRGWDPENNNDTQADFLDCQIELQTVEVGETLTIAVCRDQAPVIVRFTREPTPALTIVGSVQ